MIMMMFMKKKKKKKIRTKTLPSKPRHAVSILLKEEDEIHDDIVLRRLADRLRCLGLPLQAT
jgi:hypothetical protein